MSDDGSNNLQGSFGDKGTNVNQIGYGHPNAEGILDAAKEVIRGSDTGKILIKVHETHKIPVQIIKGDGMAGFNPQARIVYLQVPGNVKKATSAIILQLIKGLREADQEVMGLTAPDPMEDIMEYAKVMHAKNIDSIIHICKVVKELTNSSYFPDLIDAIAEIGYGDFYKAYTNNASKEELMKVYADT